MSEPTTCMIANHQLFTIYESERIRQWDTENSVYTLKVGLVAGADVHSLQSGVLPIHFENMSKKQMVINRFRSIVGK